MMAAGPAVAHLAGRGAGRQAAERIPLFMDQVIIELMPVAAHEIDPGLARGHLDGVLAFCHAEEAGDTAHRPGQVVLHILLTKHKRFRFMPPLPPGDEMRPVAPAAAARRVCAAM